MANKELLKTIRKEIISRIDKRHLSAQAKNELVSLLSFLDTLESEKPMNQDDAMKELDEKIALVKERGTWDGVDVDKYMDEVRGRELEKPMELEEEVRRYYSDNFEYLSSDQPTLSILTNIARHFAQWQKEQMMKGAVEGEVYLYHSYNRDATAILVDIPKENLGDKVRVIVCKKEDKKDR